MWGEKMSTVYFYCCETEKDKAFYSNLGKEIVKHFFYKKYNTELSQEDFKKNPNGKPFIDKNPDFHFNISHSKSAVAVAFSEKPIGVDIEKLRTTDPRVAKRFFTEKEQEYILQNPDIRFFEIWTKKEAAIKQKGLAIKDIKNISTENTETFFKDGYVISVCTENTEKTNFSYFDIQNLETF